jgi:PIN domain nuclease of toxin-antitoxin system
MELLDAASTYGETICVPSVCLVELSYLVEKGRLPRAAREHLLTAMDDPSGPFSLAPLDRKVVDAVAQLHRSEVPDLPDRVIAATALAFRLPLISRDGKIRASQVITLW